MSRLKGLTRQSERERRRGPRPVSGNSRPRKWRKFLW